MGRFFIFLVLIGLLFASCVPNKKILYLQKGDEFNSQVPRDSVLRTYNLANYQYRVQSEDILLIEIKSLTQDEFNIFSSEDNRNSINQGNLAISGFLVDQNGYITFPEIGKVSVENLTIHEIENKIFDIANNYLDAPSIKVRLLNFRITILGEVLNEGVVSTLNNRVTIFEAIGHAGGVGELADRSKVKVIRQQKGTSKVFYINLLDEEIMENDDFFVHQNDIIIVPPLKQRPFRKYFGQNLSLFVSSLSILLLTINLINN